ncbi:MAG: polymerase sigma24 factor [Ilumatobacteraceae bacterium]|nr:polymerase sigma24 factor [Ilumatobacteraceae bacterium]
MAASGSDEMTAQDFGAGLGRVLRQLRPVLIARHGTQIGAELHAEVSEFAWEHRDRLAAMGNPAGYLFRVSQSRARRYRRWRRGIDLPPERVEPGQMSDGEVLLHTALARLSADNRTLVVLVHAYGYSYDEAAALVGTSVASVRNRLHRAMTKLRQHLNEETARAHH